MRKIELLQLVKSLSASEKRFFKLYCKKQSGPKEYLALFELINLHPLSKDPLAIEIEFKKKHPTNSYENAAQYLLKLLTDALVQISITNDKWFQQYHAMMRARILFERSLPKEGVKEIKRTQKLASELQDNAFLFLSQRLELNYLSESGFVRMTEKDLVEIQMKAKSHLRQLHLHQEHSALYELLRYRLIHSGRSLSKEDTKKLNDLLISELSLITRGNQSDFESQKIHLLFQSFFLIHTGQFSSSLNSMRELYNLFESNKPRWSFPPYDYLFTLEGILDNLRTIKYFGEMEFYLLKIEALVDQKYPDYFDAIAWQTIYSYRLSRQINSADPLGAIALSNTIPAALLQTSSVVAYEKRAELIFYIGLAYFCNRAYNQAKKQMNEILTIGNVNENSGVFKAAWLCLLLIHYELDNQDLLDYQIRAYKRLFRKLGKALKIESLLFKVIKHDPKRKNKITNGKLWDRLEERIGHIRHSNFEKQLLKYYDFGLWIRDKLIDSKNLGSKD